jgi:hypothetical protein
MSLLEQSPEEIQFEKPGESYTKGSSHVVIAGVAAAILVSAAIALYVISGQKPPAATGEVVEVWEHPLHTETSGMDANGALMAKESFDQMLVFAHVRLHNQSKQPIFLYQILTNAQLADGEHSSYAAMPGDYDRIFVAYPAMQPLRATPISPDSTINPGETKEGTFVSSFRIPKDQFDARKSLDFEFAFRYLPSLKLAPQTAVIAR